MGREYIGGTVGADSIDLTSNSNTNGYRVHGDSDAVGPADWAISGGNDTITGSDFSDVIWGVGGNDIIAGGKGHDVLGGQWGSNTLDGGRGSDMLISGDGNDQLTGGSGKDIFRFTAANNSTITDFSVKDDTIRLSKAAFSTIGGNKGDLLDAGQFVTGTAADSNDVILYDINTGMLSYDADGNGAGVAVEIAMIGVGLANLTNADFMVGV